MSSKEKLVRILSPFFSCINVWHFSTLICSLVLILFFWLLTKDLDFLPIQIRQEDCTQTKMEISFIFEYTTPLIEEVLWCFMPWVVNVFSELVFNSKIRGHTFPNFNSLSCRHWFLCVRIRESTWVCFSPAAQFSFMGNCNFLYCKFRAENEIPSWNQSRNFAHLLENVPEISP